MTCPSKPGRNACSDRRTASPSPPVEYNPAFPIEKFDFIITDECHRSIYNLWRQVLEYFDASLIGLTATPSKQTFGFFQQNLVMEYDHEKAVADGVNVGYDIYRISTAHHAGAARRWTPASTWTNATARPAKSAGNSSTKRSPTMPPSSTATVSRTDQIRTVLATFRDSVLHRNLPGPHRCAQDPHLRQGRHPRRRHRAHLPRGLRQGQRLLPEDHLPHRLRPHRRKEAAGRRHGSRAKSPGNARPACRPRKSSAPFATATSRASPSPWT